MNKSLAIQDTVWYYEELFSVPPFFHIFTPSPVDSRAFFIWSIKWILKKQRNGKVEAMITKNIKVIYRADQGPVSRTQWEWPPQGATCRDADRVQSSLFSEKPFSRDYVESVHNFIIESVEFAGKRIDMYGIVI